MNYDVIVVGGGHAGIEAAAACAKAQLKTILITINLDHIGQMSCNPSIGGLAKGHLVKEIDALGGIMGKIIDKTGIQFKMLNMSKGPAVWSPRAQADKKLYIKEITNYLENQENLHLIQDNAVELITEDNIVKGVKSELGISYYGKYVVLAAGTFLKGKIHIGNYQEKAGRMGDKASNELSENLKKLGFRISRFKTGTPPRIDLRFLDKSKVVEEYGQENPIPFSIFTDKIKLKQIPCYLTRTSKEIGDLIKSNLDRAPLFSGQIEGKGPRYCPSIEDKIVRFPHHEKHQIFIEPEGLDTHEGYVNGISTSLPTDIQSKIVKMIPGLEDTNIIRFGYAIEYDYVEQYQIKHTLETRKIKNLYLAGQINGTSGYEEAAAQGLAAALNIIAKERDLEPFILQRDQGMIGVLIDDLITKGIDEPYRMFTSRAEYRLILRQDNAHRRLVPFGYKYGLIEKSIFDEFSDKEKQIYEIKNNLSSISSSPSRINPVISEKEKPVENSENLMKLLKRPSVTLDDIYKITGDDIDYDDFVKQQVEIEVKYEGYIARQMKEINKMREYSHMKIPEGFDYGDVKSLLNESREKLILVQPETIAQAMQIPGVTPADISVLLIYMKKSGIIK